MKLLVRKDLVDLEEVAQIKPGPSPQLTRLCRQLSNIGEVIKRDRKDLEQLEATYNRMSREEIPELARELGVKKMELATGEKIEIKTDIKCSLSATYKSEALAFLKNNGQEGCLKRNMDLSKLDDTAFDKLENFLKRSEIHYEREDKVHPQTLKKIVKELLGTGALTNSEFQLFNVFEFRETKIK